ncbi:hypothetical protein H072_6403 [Dactylellina haptotyla CBS 200.50]|uniref:RWD domain-containing protein n=1 Tax=Dactylellina haptotyla (strain CBS 200.50) TaxID=1284197 RepID=S8AAB9_DACHA|nr:hypothetical protein H072_6403 [Dactylellina haptotyla CBS 200.50]
MSAEISQDLLDEITSLNSIYSPTTLTLHDAPAVLPFEIDLEDGEAVCTLSPPASEINPPVCLVLKFPKDYPSTPPSILSGTTYGKGLSKEQVTQLSRDVLHNVFLEGGVVLFELVEGLKELLHTETSESTSLSDYNDVAPLASADAATVETFLSPSDSAKRTDGPTPATIDPSTGGVTYSSTIPWSITPPTTVQKSVFVGRCVSVTCAETAKHHIAELIASDRKIARATHNITDNDDDGETAAGSRLGHLLELIDVWNVVVVVSRWYGGIKLGPDRFRIINQVAREALVLGGFVDEHGNAKGDQHHESAEVSGAGGGKKKKKGKHH